MVDDEENGTYGCIYPQKVLQRLAHKLNKKLERIEMTEYGENGIFSGFKFYKFFPRNLGALKPPMKGGHTHNAFFNALNRLLFRGKNSRKFNSKQFKKGCVAIFHENMKIKENRRLIMETLNKHTRRIAARRCWIKDLQKRQL